MSPAAFVVEYARVEANGLSFRIATAGSGKDLVLLLHGFPESCLSWRHQIEPIARSGYRVWAPDLRGYGGTSRPPGVAAYRMEALLEDVTALIDAAGCARAVLVGHDWGGVIGWYYAMRRPERLRGLIALNAPHPACFDRESRHWRQQRRIVYMGLFQLPMIPEWVLGASRARAIGAVLASMIVNRDQLAADVIRHHRQLAAEPGALTAMLNYYRAAFRGGGAARQRRLGYPRIEVPTLVLWGLRDRALVRENLDGLEALVGPLQVVPVNSAGHFVHQDDPQRVNAEILGWLGRRRFAPAPN